jgi:hypothetical protein
MYFEHGINFKKYLLKKDVSNCFKPLLIEIIKALILKVLIKIKLLITL